MKEIREWIKLVNRTKKQIVANQINDFASFDERSPSFIEKKRTITIHNLRNIPDPKKKLISLVIFYFKCQVILSCLHPIIF